MMAKAAEILRGFDLCDGHSDVDRAVLMLLWGIQSGACQSFWPCPLARVIPLPALCERTFGDRVWISTLSGLSAAQHVFSRV